MQMTRASLPRGERSLCPVTPSIRALSCRSGTTLSCRHTLQQDGPFRRTRDGTCEATSASPPQVYQSEGAPPPLKRMQILEGAVDDPQLGNPLQRMHRLGTGWFGVIFELEGVLVEDAHENHAKAWTELVERLGRERPPQWALKRAEGMKSEQVITEVLCLTRLPEQVKRLAREKEEIFVRLQADRKPVAMPGVIRLLETLRKHDIPVAVATSEPEARVLDSLERAGLRPAFHAIVTADDVARGRPDPEPYLYAAYALGRPPLRCVVIGNSNLSIEAAHEVGMQCVSVATRHPMYELTASDLVLRTLESISVQNLKQLFGMEQGVEPAQPELQPEVTQPKQQTMFADDDRYNN